MYRRWLLLLNHFLVVACVSLNQRFDSAVYHHIEKFKSRMLKELGLSNVPSLANVNTTDEEMQRMLDVYHQKLKEDEMEEQRSRHASLLEYTSLTAKANHSSEEDRERSFFFLLPNVPPETQMLHSATLRLSKHPNSTGLLRVFQITSSGQHLVSESSLSVSNEWEVFDLSRIVREWIKDPSSNSGIRVECIRCEGFVSNQATLELLVSNRGRRVKRSTERKRKRRKHNTDCVKGKKNGCCRKPLTVSFSDIGWNWVIQPKTFDAYFCRGRCIEGSLLIGSHAVIKQTLWKKSGGKRSMRLCCVPEKTIHLRVLHYSNQNPPQLETTRLRNIIVKHCGCA